MLSIIQFVLVLGNFRINAKSYRFLINMNISHFFQNKMSMFYHELGRLATNNGLGTEWERGAEMKTFEKCSQVILIKYFLILGGNLLA